MEWPEPPDSLKHQSRPHPGDQPKRGLGRAACKESKLLHADRVHQRVGMSMHQSPVGTLATEHQGHPQRPVLIGEAADRAVLPLDAHQNDEVARDVRLLELEVRVSTAGEEFLQCLDARRRRVAPVPRRPTVRGHQRVVGRLVHEREIAADVALHQRAGGLADALDQLAEVSVGDAQAATPCAARFVFIGPSSLARFDRWPTRSRQAQSRPSTVRRWTRRGSNTCEST